MVTVVTAVIITMSEFLGLKSTTKTNLLAAVCDLINLVHIPSPQMGGMHQVSRVVVPSNSSKYIKVVLNKYVEWPKVPSSDSHNWYKYTIHGVERRMQQELLNLRKRVGKQKHEETKPRSLPDASPNALPFLILSSSLSGSNGSLRQLPYSLHISFHASLNIALTN